MLRDYCLALFVMVVLPAFAALPFALWVFEVLP